MAETPSVSPWFADRFGEHSPDVMRALADAGRAAHERSLEAKGGSRLTTDDAYGSFWVILPEEVAAHLDFLPGREVIRPWGSRYDVVVFDGTLVFPAKCGRGSRGADDIRLGRSGFRRRVFSLERVPWSGAQEMLPLDLGGGREPHAVLPDGSFGSAERVMLVAYDCSAELGLRMVHVGAARLDLAGRVEWEYREELPLAVLGADGR